ncbi:TPA: DNA circularization N-terminal domain-containing protein [Citrobacter sedlakii]|nr:DNA circularization N-terminal domain-containing protein [Citrobacter sedlakii]HCA7134012.1 DNA circularization N-terminal domain-containing protein [Citrobacter sedlakii]HCA7180146.1 DNA circularization N-terminal domain-containing protein [Citrobacter sedlakii]
MALFSSSGWSSRLRAASFRGVPFSVEDDEGSFGRRVQVHEYPNRDKPFTEDLGRATRRFSVNAYLIGDDYADQRDKLLIAIETSGPGTLVHPFYGEMQGSIDGVARVIHSNTEGRMCRVTFQFVESGELSFPVAGIATGKKLGDSASWLDDAIDSVFSAFSLDGLTDFLQSDILADGAAMLDDVADAFRMVDEGVSAAMRLLQGDLSVILMPPSAASDFVNALQKAWRAGDRLTGDTSDLVTSVRTMAGVTVDPGLAPRGVWPTDSGTVKIQKAKSNLVAAAIRTTAISEAVKVVTALPQPQVAASQSRQSSGMTGGATAGIALSETDIINVPHPVLDSSKAFATSSVSATAGKVSVDSDSPSPATWDDLTVIRTMLNEAIDREQNRATDDGLFLTLSTLRADLNRDISQRLAQVERTAERTPAEVLPALVLAASWYDDASRADEILNRNTIRHPGFVPARPLRVPVR